ncbi:hypothetical protein AB0C61_22530 [Streptomyces sp. NPDC048680]|uniref:hypothetical protein n=1 Tax=Streptomyces sp. NPDC048680 TaxID=3155492 RepID=UPI00341F4F2C
MNDFGLLWQRKIRDPESARSALVEPGHEVERADATGKSPDGTLRVEAMAARFENGREVTPEGARVGLRVRRDARVTAFTQKANPQVSVNGPYPETGCFEPRAGH